MPWSDELTGLTRRALREGTATFDGSLWLKHVDGRFGTICLADQLAGRFVIVDRRSGAESRFRDAEALIADGWAVD